MHDITIVCTRHEELGNCNLDELYVIFEAIKPDLIFEEIPSTYYDRYYKYEDRRTLESDTISKFADTYKVKHVPVDSNDIPNDSFFDSYYSLLIRIESLTDINGADYRYLIDTNKDLIRTHGFVYLNSTHGANVNDKINETIEKGLHTISNDKFHQTYNLWKDINDKRENEMLQNIYKYSKENNYNKAIFTIGVGHRKSLMQKIIEFEKSNLIKLNWTFYGD